MLSTENLAIGHRKKVLLEQLNLRLEAGELVCLIGPNGVGKSTLLKTLAGLLPPLSGHLMWNQVPVRSLSSQQRAQYLALILTDRVEAGFLTGRELVALGRYPFTGWSGQLTYEDQCCIEEAIQETGATHIAERLLMELSDGERQRLMIARALAQKTPVILADEPTAFLDFPGKAALFRWMYKWAKTEKKAILVTTHDLHLAFSFASRFWLIDRSGILTDLSPHDMVQAEVWKDTFPEWNMLH
ncbi:MAG TPA: ABC transporter ATP-binding protein [Rhodothermales bacterium]|nr:ABC transporter ATP-binding protein [Rhodothermales bacterium]HRR09749.1 ABC transporter ATP-binding protein [Rhodothermales bacterium]